MHQHDSVQPTVRSHQGQIRKSEHIPWDENVVSSHYIDDVQLTDCVTDEFRFQQKKGKKEKVFLERKTEKQKKGKKGSAETTIKDHLRRYTCA